MQELYSGPILDFHTHPFICKEQNICFYKDTVAGTLAEYMEDMERCGIVRYAGTPLQNEPSAERPEFRQIRLLNREALELREATKGRYIPGFHIHPAYPKESMEEIRLMEREGVHLVGELVPYWMGWSGYGYNAPEVYELFQAAGEAGMIISLHSGSPDEMDALLEACPHTVIVGAHPGEKNDFLRHVERMKKHPNYYLDLCGSAGVFRNGMIRKCLNEVGSHRLLYGSDYPVCTPGGTLGAVFFERLSEEERSNILYKNAAALLRL